MVANVVALWTTDPDVSSSITTGSKALFPLADLPQLVKQSKLNLNGISKKFNFSVQWPLASPINVVQPPQSQPSTYYTCFSIV